MLLQLLWFFDVCITKEKNYNRILFVPEKYLEK